MTRTILVVDDNAVDRSRLQELLKQQYIVITAESGDEMISVLRQRGKWISAIVLALFMPENDGLDALRRIRDDVVYCQVPVIVISERNDEQTQAKVLALGAAGFMAKPYNSDILLYLLRNTIHLREKSAIINTFNIDLMTGLLNRKGFFEQAADRIRQHKAGYYVLSCFDVENFKVINDQYGLDVGDEILKYIAKSADEAITSIGGICCRDAADKFGMLYPAEYVCSDRIKALHETVMSADFLGCGIKIRVGRYFVDNLTMPVSAMYDRATIAEESIKGRYDTYIAEYNDIMRQSIVNEQRVVNDMTGALEAGEFETWFQPQYNHATGALIGAEALVRWHKDDKIIPPLEFIPIFERNGFIYELDRYIWRSVCILLRRWLNEGKNPLPVSVNISRFDLLQDGFLDYICALTEEYRLPSGLLCLEVTESAFAESSNSVYAVVNELINRGFTVEIDDFGSGYSSLNTLKDVAASIIKLDMRFFERTGDAKRGGNIVESVVRMAKWLGMAVIAEGVEDMAQADYLKSIGCFYIQGYLYAKPMPTEEYEKRLDSNLKEDQLTHLKTLQHLNNNDFWDSRSMDTLIFNSYVGAACIVELMHGKAEMLRATDHMAHILGGDSLSIKDILAIDWAEHVDAANARSFMNSVQKSLDTKESVSGEFEFHGLPGCQETVILRCIMRVIATVGDRSLIYCLSENITAQRAAERAALVASERVNAVMDNSHCGISAVIARRDGTVELLFVNNRFFEILGYNREQYMAEVKSPYDRIVPEERERVMGVVSKLDTVGSSISLEVREMRRDGSIVWLRSDISIVKFANVPEPVQIGSFLDITEQKENDIKRLESASRLEIIMSNVNGGVSAFQVYDDATSKCVFNNDKYYSLFGYTREEALADNLDIMTLIVPDDLPFVMAKIKEMKQDRQPRMIDYRITKKDGSYAMLRSNISLMSIPGYGDDVITSVVTDITEKKSLEETLGAIISNMNGGISATYLKNGRIEYVIANEQYYRIIGYTKEEFEEGHLNIIDLLHPDDRERVEKKLMGVQEFGEQYTIEFRIVLRDGSVRNILHNTSVFHLFGVDEPVQLSVSNDITEIREMQRKELALSAQLQTIMKNIHGGITATLFHDDNNIEIVFSNDSFYEMYGYTREQMEAEVSNILDLIFDEDRKKTMETVARIVRERTGESYEYRCHKRDGSTVWIQCTNSVFSMDGVGDTVLLALTTDVTELRTAQHEQLAATDRLRAVMNAMPNGMTAVVYRDEGMEFLFDNDRYYEMHGIHRGDIGKDRLSGALSLAAPEFRDTLFKAIHEAATCGHAVSVDYRMNRTDGANRWARAIISMTTLAGVDAPVQVAVYSDITAETEAVDQLRFLNESAHDILAQPGSDKAITDTLRKLLDYFKGERTYVFELHDDTKTSDNTYELCAPGVTPARDWLQGVSYDIQQYWFDYFHKIGFVTISDVAAMGDDESDMRELLLMQNIRSIIVAPLWRDDRLIGYIGVDNPTNVTDQISRLIAIADYIAVLLTRRDLMRKIKHDGEMVQQLMDDTPGGFLRIELFEDKNPSIVTVNEGMCRMLGMTKAEVMEAYGDNVYACLADSDSDSAPDEITKAYTSGGNYTSTRRLRKKDGSLFWVMLFGRFVCDENGHRMLNAYFTDISDKLAEDKKQGSLLDNLPFGAAMYEFDGNRLTVFHINRQYWKLVGRKPTEYDKTSVTDAIHPDDRAVTIHEIRAAIRQGRSAVVDMRILDGNGGYSPFHVTASIVPQSDGKYRLYAAYSPISNEAISLQEMLPVAMSTMMATSDDISYIKGKDLHYIACSQALAGIAGYADTKDIVGKNAYGLFGRAFAEKSTEDDLRIMETGKAEVDCIEHIPTADRGIILARTSKYPIRDAIGDVIGVYCISHDVTAQRQRDSQLDLLSRNIPGGLASYSVSANGIKTLYFNDGFFAYSGYTRAEYTELTEKEPLALMFEEDRTKLRDMLRTFATEKRDGMTGSCEYRCHTKDGQTRYMSLKAVLTQLDADQYVLNTVQFDMTRHVEIERRMENLLDNLPFGAAMYEFDGESLKALHINQQFQVIVHREQNKEKPVYYKAENFIHPEDRSIAINAIKEAVADHRDVSCNIRILYDTSEYRYFHIDARVTAKPDGKYLIYVAYTRLSEQELTFENALPHIFSTIMESSTDIAFAKDINFRYICCSKTFATLLGLKSEKDVVGKTDYELFPKEIADMFRRDDSSLLTTQKPLIDKQELLPSPDGTVHYIRTSKHLMRNDTDTVIGIYCVGRDITEVREAYAQLRLLTDSIPGGIATFRCSPGSIEVLYFNDGICELAGYTRDDYTAHPFPFLDLIFAEDRPIIRSQFELLTSGETSLNFTMRIHPKNGGYKWISVVATVVDHANDVYNVNAVLTDVTEQQEEKERLRLAEEEYRIATIHSGHTIGRYDIAAQTLTISEDVSAKLALPESIPNVPYSPVKLGIISKNTSDEYIAFYEKIMHGEKECSVTFQKLFSIGWRWINERATTIFDDDGKPVSAIISYSDVTDQQEKEAVYRKWQQNLTQNDPRTFTLYRCNLNLNGSYDSVDGELLNIHESWGDADKRTFNEHTDDFAENCVAPEDRDMFRGFVNSDAMLASYYRGKRSAYIEFKGIIATGELHWIRLSVELVEYPNTKDVAAYLMFEDINDSKLTALRTQTMAETDPLTGLLNRKTFIARMDKMLAARRSKTLYALLLLDLDSFKFINDSFGHGTGDQLLIDTARAIQSVLRDSDLVCRMGGDEFLICISAVPNRSIVLNKAKQILGLIHRIFKLEVTMSVSVGIAVCPDDGNTFDKLYPKADKALYHVKGHGKDNYAFYDMNMKTVFLSMHGRTVTPIDAAVKPVMLIVDSQKSSREMMSGAFADDFRVETADNGAEALDFLRYHAHGVSVMLLSLDLPDTDGCRLLEHMQEEDVTADIPVVAVGGEDGQRDILNVIKAGASDYVTKPIDPTLLRIRVESAIAKAENERLRAQNRFLAFLKDRENKE